MYAKGKFKLVKLLAVVIYLFLAVLILLKGRPESVEVDVSLTSCGDTPILLRLTSCA